MDGLLHNSEITMNTSVATSSTSIFSPWIDFADCKGCVFLLVGTSLLGAKTLTAQVLGCTISSSTGNAHVYSAFPMSTVGGFSTDMTSFLNKMAAIDVIKPPYRFNRVRWDGSTGVNTAQPSRKLVQIKYGMRRRGSSMTDATSCFGTFMSTKYVVPTT